MKALLKILPFCRQYRWRFIWGILFVLITNIFAVKIPVAVGQAVNSISNRPELSGELAWWGAYIVSLAGLAGCFRYLMRRVLIDTSRDVEYDFRNHVYTHLQTQDPTFYVVHPTGDIMSRMTNDMDNIRMMIGPAVMYTANTVFSLPMVLIAMLALDWRVTLLGLLPMALMPLLVGRIISVLHERSREQQDQLSELTTFVQESIAGIRVIKAYCQEDAYFTRFGEENRKYIDRCLAVDRIESFFFPTIRLIAGIGLLSILFFGAKGILAGRFQYGTLVSQVMLFGMLIWPLIAAGWVLNLFQRAGASMDRIMEVLNVKPRVAESPTTVPAAELPQELYVEFRNLTFTYEGAQRPALQEISLKVPAGRTIGIVGRVGSGKSTLIHLLPRFYPVERGQLFIGGIDINDWPIEELRRRVGVVFQETFLFSDTIGGNIRFGALAPLSDGEVEEAARKADVHKDIAEFPDAYGTVLGERGINLSGGQKQRVSMARALVRDAAIMILDDSLSAVDTHTEEAILASLRGVMKDRTTFLISHRISTVAPADEIIVLEDGRISLRGTHEQLVVEAGLYRDLYRRQLLEEEVESVG